MKRLSFFLLFMICSWVTQLSSQDRDFSFGVRTAAAFSQIEGDNLRGFKKINYELGLLGGYRLNAGNELQLSLNYEQLGSRREGENVPLLAGRYLSEVSLTQMSLYWAFAKSFGADWDSSYKYQAAAGVKYNRLLSTRSNLLGASIIDSYTLEDEDFKTDYLSIRLGCSMFVGSRFLVGLFYEHALESLLKSHDEQRINKLIPFGFALNVSFYLH